jgi:DNA-binding MarR family transcriptional regulator
VSHRATAYVKELRVCPNGEPLSKMEKLVLYGLADYHQDKMGLYTYPSVETLAAEALMSKSSCQRSLKALELKGVLGRERNNHQGRGRMTFYRLVEIDGKGCQADTLFPDSAAPERATKGLQKGVRGDKPPHPLIGRTGTGTKANTPPPCPPPHQAGDGADGLDAAVDQVMQDCGFTARRLRLKLRAVIEQQDKRADTYRPFESPAEVAAAMVDAWKRYAVQGLRLRVHLNAARFFEEGYWLDSKSWHWDGDAIREERKRMEASVGSVQ